MDILTTERAILELKRLFEDTLSAALSLSRVSAPIMVAGDSGIQDNLRGWPGWNSRTRINNQGQFGMIFPPARWNSLRQ